MGRKGVVENQFNGSSSGGRGRRQGKYSSEDYNTWRKKLEQGDREKKQKVRDRFGGLSSSPTGSGGRRLSSDVRLMKLLSQDPSYML